MTGFRLSPLVKAAGVRAVRTFCQVVAAAVSANASTVTDLPWESTLALAAGSTLLSVLMSVIKGLPEVGE